MISSRHFDRSFFSRVSDVINAELEKHFWGWSLLFAALLLASGIFQDIRKLLWTDELLTLYTSRQGSATQIIRATLEGMDGTPPLYAMVTKACSLVVKNEALALRLPSTLCFVGMLVGILAFCRRRMPAAYAMCAALFAYQIFPVYLTEGRPYGVVMGCAAGALLCWQLAIEGRHRIIALGFLAILLSLMTAMHYFAIFFLVPLVLAEMVRWRVSRKVDWGILVTVFPMLLVLILHYPFIAAGKRFEPHFWSPASWGDISFFYEEFFWPRWARVVLLVGIVAILLTRANDLPEQPSLTPPEFAFTIGLLLMPLCVIVISILVTHMFVPRYTAWAAPGFAIFAVGALCTAARKRPIVGICMLTVVFSLAVLRETYHVLVNPTMQWTIVARQVSELPEHSQAIVVDDIHVFLQMSYYDHQIVKRLIYPLNHELALRYQGNDTLYLLSDALRHRVSLPIMDYDKMIAEHASFILVALPGDFMPWHFIREGYRVVPIDSSIPPMLYQVSAPEKTRQSVQ